MMFSDGASRSIETENKIHIMIEEVKKYSLVTCLLFYLFSHFGVSHSAVSHLLLSRDVVIDEGNPLVGPLTPHTGDPGNGHLTGLDGRLGAVAAKLCLFLQTQRVVD